MKIRHVVYSHREGLRWYFIDTMNPETREFVWSKIKEN